MRARLVKESLNDSVMFTEEDVNKIKEVLPGEKSLGRFFVGYDVAKKNDSELLVIVQVDGKRGLPREAELKAIYLPRPPLPAGYQYAPGGPIDFSGEPMTPETIRERDEIYSDRGYTDSEFSGYVCHKVIKMI